ncbi:major facilitator superfamily protein [Hirsutella rhossiliensis]|uniref:Major facilitator superfamily domain-containing protein n=1 Tax=Hirsutella rhossiliensis TaxID=111463 RepID=A0A9P8N2E4_9HYPO|nr:major facilitator superfamily domain-containing protein [Hirsutella rhossiliensis]KAH0965620.1 major facilitator superfamily domain-containing protein [Hirsutella rhossiliensis]
MAGLADSPAAGGASVRSPPTETASGEVGLDADQLDRLSRSLPSAGALLEPEPSYLAVIRPVLSKQQQQPTGSNVATAAEASDDDVAPMSPSPSTSAPSLVSAPAPSSSSSDGLDGPPGETSPLLRPRAASHGDDNDDDEPLPLFLNDMSPGRFWLVFSQVLAAQFIGCFDGTIMASSHPVITSYFGAANSASWLSTAFLLASTAVQPLLGRLSDAVGRKPLFLGCMAVFAVATAWCALATSIESFIVARAVCGIGAGGAVTLGSIITSDLVPIERRGAYQSYMNVTYGVGSALGAALGGAMAEALGWRWEFGVQIPPLVLCVGVSAVVIPRGLGVARHEGGGVWRALRTFDAAGSLLLTASVSFLILGLNLGGNVLPWAHPLVVTSLVVFALCFPCFIAVESRVAKPIMPLHLIRRSPRANLIFANFIAALVSNSIFFNIPLYFQAVLLSSATASGLRLVLPSVVASIAGTSTGFAITWSRRLKWPLVTGTLFYLAGCLCLCLLRRDLPSALYLVALVPSSLGQGFQFPGTFMAILACSPQSEQAVVTSTLILWRSLGMVLGVASSSLVLQNALVHYLDRYVQGPDRLHVIALVRASVDAIARLDQPYRLQVVRSYEAALRLTFVCCVAMAALSVLLIWPVRLPRLAARKRQA